MDASAGGCRVTSLVVDGRTVSARDGQTLLDACREAGIDVPSLCHQPGLPAPASCRLCLVEVHGFRRPMPACRTRPWEGMVVTTETPALTRNRRDTLELLLAGGGHVCAFCPASGSCELQALASRHGLDHVRHGRTRRAPAVDASRARFSHDPGRCVLCTRCVRVCAEVERAATLSVAGRGEHSHISFDGGLAWGQAASCTDCGRCAEVCPTGAMLVKEWGAQGIFRRPGVATPTPTATPTATATATPTPTPTPTRKLRLATVWLGGCSGCHMSLLDLDERLLALADRIDLVRSPLVDVKEYPEGVDVCLVEGAVSEADHEPLLRRIRARTRLLVALGDCACTGNVTALRNGRGGAAAVERRQAQGAGEGHLAGHPLVPALLPEARPLHECLEVDLYLPGCPPPAALLAGVLEDLAAGRPPAPARPRFG
jgi:coenzyme F420-reducing hydrogenase gamma subunit